MLRVTGAARVYADRTIFEDVTLDVGAGDCLALIGENGSGKSTLLRLLAGLDAPDAGTVTRTGRVALLAQDETPAEGTMLDAVTPTALRQARAAFERTSADLGTATDEAFQAFAEAEEHYRLCGGYDFEARAGAVLAGLNLDGAARATQLSGGQTRRALLARLLLDPAEVYLLDEPTNHLDADGAAWLEGWLRASGAAFVLASHDRAFLDAVATRTAELERGELHEYPGGYSEAMALKAALREAQARDYAAYQRKRAALRQEQGRLRAAGESAGHFNLRRAGNVPLIAAKNKASQVSKTLAGRSRALERQLDRLEDAAVDKPYADHRAVRLDLPPAPPGPAEVLTAQHLSVARGDKEVLSGVTLHVRRGDRVALTGPNGGGKSTLLRALLGELPHSGTVRWGQGLTLYVAGQGGEELYGLATVGDALLATNPALTPHQLHEVAAGLQVPGGPQFPLSTLSGGQRTRLSLARLRVTRAQVLVLDEPTNHLDVRAIEALEGLLADYPGTVLLATHDRALTRRVATRRWQVESGQVKELEVVVGGHLDPG
ncbi:ABC-F family ATP-binding cassette domain-containing protein [Deinococcus arboris]|uniref:ABC-F family ATP-binding cassette domain-containing protein n=1 Tax=Deinococcus arboris TaxID=2682977 RepID=UPI0018DB0D46|nr:ABC-F family ATP-binding cassette domain-containing protein [Deinococcus arboris]